MGMLERYKKPGGFVQLLSLIETTQQSKREKFLSMIKDESPIWEENIKQRVLSIDKILTWPDEVLREIFGHYQLITVAGVISSLVEDQRQIIFKLIGSIETRKITNFLEEKQFTANEIQTSIEKFVTEVRNLISMGHIKPMQFDSSLVIPTDIDEKLMQLSSKPTVNVNQVQFKKPNQTPLQQAVAPVNTPLPTEVTALQTELANLRKAHQEILEENNELRKNLQIHLEKIEKVKKLFA